MGRTRSIHRHFVSEPQAASAARRELEQLADQLDPGELRVTALLVTELVTNSVLHAGLGNRGIVRLEVTVSDVTIRAEVRDRGIGFEPPVPRSDPLSGDWGLRLLNALADRWTVDTDGSTVVSFELNRRTMAPHD